MNKPKIISVFISLIVGLFIFAGQVRAADDLIIRINQPKTPTNQRAFDLSFVAMDIENRAISVACSMKDPDDSGFSSVGSVVSLPAGGGSGSCFIPEDRVVYTGDYQYRVIATADGVTATATVLVAYSNTIPQAPSDYRKEKLNNCDYKIFFHTNEGTDRVDLYRSENSSFNADPGTKVSGLNIGINQNGEITNSVPDCNKTYYFAIRAFNSAGNGSDIVGDREVNTVVITPSSESVSSGAIPVSGSGVTPQVLGEDTEKLVLDGQDIDSASETGAEDNQASDESAFDRFISNPLTWLVGLGLAGLIIFISRRKTQ